MGLKGAKSVDRYIKLGHKKGGYSRRWTEEEEDKLKRMCLLYASLGKTVKEVATVLAPYFNRTIVSIISKADNMHLTKGMAKYATEYAQTPSDCV